MSQPVSRVVGMIEVDEPTEVIALLSAAREPRHAAPRRLAGHWLHADRFSSAGVPRHSVGVVRLRANLKRLCDELSVELARLRQSLDSPGRASPDRQIS